VSGTSPGLRNAAPSIESLARTGYEFEATGPLAASSGIAGSADDLVRMGRGRNASPAFAAQPRGVTPPAPVNVPLLRQQYVNAVNGLSKSATEMRAAGKSAEEIARALHAQRRALGVQYKNLTPNELLQQIYERNLAKYGDKLGPTIDYLRNKGKSWEEIIESACRTGGKDLGL
jgi:hypothetical protein